MQIMLFIDPHNLLVHLGFVKQCYMLLYVDTTGAIPIRTCPETVWSKTALYTATGMG